jgi:translation initiation factor 5
MLNINGKNDLSYRYKMTPISSQICGKVNGVVTIISNIDTVSKDINQPSEIIIKVLSLNFGTSCNLEKNSITGGFSSEQIQESLQTYINKFIMCPSCSIPETIPNINKENKKNMKLELKCSSCGSISEINCKNKSETKITDLIIKYLEKNDWIVSKGNMVHEEKTSKSNNDSLNPFS